MKINIIGGGPAGLLFACLMKHDDPSHDIRVYERNREDSTYGWGVVFSDVALAFVRDAAPQVHASIARHQIVFDDVVILHQGCAVTLARNPFHRMSRIDLLRALHKECRRVGVAIEFECRIGDISELPDCDLTVAADGANSDIRKRYQEQVQPSLDERPNWLAWFGTTRLFEPLSLIFRQNEHGLQIAHAYQFSATHSTFLVEVDPTAFRNAGLDHMNEVDSLRYCERAFAQDLQGHALLSNNSAWFKYTIVKSRRWHHANIVFLGDALRTGHPSIGSGTRLAMQDSIALFDAYRTCGSSIPQLLTEFVRIRQPGSDSLQEAAIKSTQWYETVQNKLHLDPISFAYDYVMRTGRVAHNQLRERDPDLAAAYERLHPEARF